MVIHTLLITYSLELLAETPCWDRFLSSFRRTMLFMRDMGMAVLASFDGRRVIGKRENASRPEERGVVGRLRKNSMKNHVNCAIPVHTEYSFPQIHIIG